MPVALLGAAIVVWVTFRWFAEVVHESESGTYGAQVDRSFRMGMIWFILSEVMFFACFFGALLYARQLALPWLGGSRLRSADQQRPVARLREHLALQRTGERSAENYESMAAWGVPALNTAILLTSGVTLTIAHHALKDNRRGIAGHVPGA